MSLIKKGPSPALTLAHPANSRHSPGRAASGAKKSPGEETSALALACTPAAVRSRGMSLALEQGKPLIFAAETGEISWRLSVPPPKSSQSRQVIENKGSEEAIFVCQSRQVTDKKQVIEYMEIGILGDKMAHDLLAHPILRPRTVV